MAYRIQVCLPPFPVFLYRFNVSLMIGGAAPVATGYSWVMVI